MRSNTNLRHVLTECVNLEFVGRAVGGALGKLGATEAALGAASHSRDTPVDRDYRANPVLAATPCHTLA